MVCYNIYDCLSRLRLELLKAIVANSHGVSFLCEVDGCADRFFRANYALVMHKLIF